MSITFTTLPGRSYVASMTQAGAIYALEDDGSCTLLCEAAGATQLTFQARTRFTTSSDEQACVLPLPVRNRGNAPLESIDQSYNADSLNAPSGRAIEEELNRRVGGMSTTDNNVSIPGGLAVDGVIDAAAGVQLGTAPATDADAASAGFAAAMGVLMTAALHKPPFDALSLTGGWSSSVCVRGTQYASLKSTTEVSSALLSTINTAFLGGSISMHVASVLQLSTSGVKFTVVLGDISPLTQQTKQGLDGWRWVPTADSTVNTLTAHPIDIACVYKDGAYKPRVRQLVYEEGRWRVRTWWPDVTLTAASTQTLVFIPGNADGSLFMIGTHWGGGIVELQHVSIPSANNNSLNKVRAVYVDSPGSAAAGNVTGLAYIGSELVTREQLLAALRAKAAMGNTLTVTEEVEDYVFADSEAEVATET